MLAIKLRPEPTPPRSLVVAYCGSALGLGMAGVFYIGILGSSAMSGFPKGGPVIFAQAPSFPDTAATTPGSSGPSTLDPCVVFFPSTPPIYGAAISPQSTGASLRVNGRVMEPPEDLADYVGEIFYPAVGTRLFNGSLSGKLEERLAAYRASRTALLDDLAAALAEQQNTTPDAREKALRSIAARQADPLAELEREAERLRRDLIKGTLFSENVEWNLGRNWRLGERNLASGTAKAYGEYQVARAAAFFQDGLSIEQRGLARELAMELGRGIRSPRGRPPVADNDPAAIFLAPETARFRLPQPLPPALVSLLGHFNAEKSALKRELLEALAKFDSLSDAKRAARFSDLAGHQAPRLAALELQAEEIRRGLAASAAPPPALPPLPVELRDRIDRYARERETLLAENQAARQRGRDNVRTDWKVFVRAAPAQRERMARERQQHLLEAMNAAAQDFTEKNASRAVDLRQRYDQIRADLAMAATGQKDLRTNQPMTAEGLLAAYGVAMQRFDAIGREEAMYERYKYAMLLPGLSPPQRRLLFRAAHAGLALSLPPPDVVTYPQERPRAPL